MKSYAHWLFGRWLFSLALGLVAVTAAADTPERVLWDKRPINVQLQIGHERLIHFPDEMRYWLPDSIKHKVTVLAANGVLYIKALESFPRSRIRIQGLSDQQVFLLDVIAGDVATGGDELIVITQESVRNLSKESTSYKNTEDWRIRLTRYAAKQLYAPERLAGSDSAIKRIALELSSPVPLIRGELVETVPIASWRGNGLTVTAVKVRNLSMQPLQLRFNNTNALPTLNLTDRLRGDWLTATVQHSYLGLAGSESDTTTLYLVSNQSFLESLKLIPSNTKQQSGEQHDG
ncbi:TIGR03749 family integrating conjugative element protein [Dasania sp. GY-19]|uniref:TIGR03749 family integrating conjugative element protein n=1 Tax=Dasania phycosphaerae TaxID=2950436 RepID=A0A9J6RQW5_9GAMM|nr:TIGR03749 family integrating conjugative element protein [Dasania phycosphaerae]MCZ0866754.1 TIGR03749 family integrating conjugative element protein [Dasania phycosphaerae]